MTIRKQLQAMIMLPDAVMRGTVDEITEKSIFVSSPVGRKEFQVVNPSTFKDGDKVKFQGNTYLGRIPPELESTIYVV